MAAGRNMSAKNQQTAQQVLVFDSGVGGISISREIITALPQIRLHYISDNAAFPYGEKPAELLIERACAVLQHACKTINPAILVIACNTASTVVLPRLRELLDIPIVGVVPAIKTAAAISKTKTFGLLATPGTVSRAYTDELINRYAANHQVIRLGSAQLVKHIEAFIHGENIDYQYIEDIVKQLSDQTGGDKLDTIVLGCTHFPLISAVFQQIQPSWQWIDSGAAIAARVSSLLKEQEISVTTDHNINICTNQKHSAWLTKASDKQLALDKYLAQFDFASSKILSI